MLRSARNGVPDAVRAMPLFAGCSEHELRAVVRMGTTITVDAGHVLARQGRRGFEFFVVVDGEATCDIDGVDVATFSAGDFFGEIGLAEHRPRTATVVAATEMKILVIDCREFGALIALAPTAASRIQAAMAERSGQPVRSNA